MLSMDTQIGDVLESAGWPCQRLRLGFGSVLFFFFETLIGKALPIVLPFIILGVGVGALLSAFQAIRTWRFEARLALVRAAIKDARKGGKLQ